MTKCHLTPPSILLHFEAATWKPQPGTVSLEASDPVAAKPWQADSCMSVLDGDRLGVPSDKNIKINIRFLHLISIYKVTNFIILHVCVNPGRKRDVLCMQCVINGLFYITNIYLINNNKNMHIFL